MSIQDLKQLEESVVGEPTMEASDDEILKHLNDFEFMGDANLTFQNIAKRLQVGNNTLVYKDRDTGTHYADDWKKSMAKFGIKSKADLEAWIKKVSKP